MRSLCGPVGTRYRGGAFIVASVRRLTSSLRSAPSSISRSLRDTLLSAAGTCQDGGKALITGLSLPSFSHRDPPERERPTRESNVTHCVEWPTDTMSVAQLQNIRCYCLASSAAYILARRGARAVEQYVGCNLPGFRVDFTLSNDDHITLVDDATRTVIFASRGTCGKHTPRKQRDVRSYATIVRTHFSTDIDPKDDPRFTGSVAAARAAQTLYSDYEEFRCVGHSLGGFVATICAQELNCPATNFNGPVYRPTHRERGGILHTTESRIRLLLPSMLPSLVKTPPMTERRTRLGEVHHLRLGNDVVSLVGGAQPHECERYTRLPYDGPAYDILGAHMRENILRSIDREIQRAAARVRMEPTAVLLRATRYRPLDRPPRSPLSNIAPSPLLLPP